MQIDPRKIFEAIVEPVANIDDSRADILDALRSDGEQSETNQRYNNGVIGLLALSGVEGADELEMDGVFGEVAERVFDNLCDAIGIPKDDEEGGEEEESESEPEVP